MDLTYESWRSIAALCPLQCTLCHCVPEDDVATLTIPGCRECETRDAAAIEGILTASVGDSGITFRHNGFLENEFFVLRAYLNRTPGNQSVNIRTREDISGRLTHVAEDAREDISTETWRSIFARCPLECYVRQRYLSEAGWYGGFTRGILVVEHSNNQYVFRHPGFAADEFWVARWLLNETPRERNIEIRALSNASISDAGKNDSEQPESCDSTETELVTVICEGAERVAQCPHQCTAFKLRSPNGASCFGMTERKKTISAVSH